MTTCIYLATTGLSKNGLVFKQRTKVIWKVHSSSALPDQKSYISKPNTKMQRALGSQLLCLSLLFQIASLMSPLLCENKSNVTLVWGTLEDVVDHRKPTIPPALREEIKNVCEIVTLRFSLGSNYICSYQTGD